MGQTASGEQPAAGGGSASAGAGTSASTPGAKEEPILLNVYTPAPQNGQQQMNVPGFGVYHTGLQVYGREYAFVGGDSSSSGIQPQEPRYMPDGAPWVYKQTEKVGTTLLTRSQVETLISKMGAEYPNNSYNLIARNCNHFSDDLCKRISKNKTGIPGWVNRTAGFANAFFGSGAAGPGGRAPPAAAAPEPEPSVFTKPGYSLSTGAVVDPATAAKKKPSEAKKSPVKSGGSNAAPAKRKNPWADPNFKPSGKALKETALAASGDAQNTAPVVSAS